MKTKFVAVLLALLPISLISCDYRNSKPLCIYSVAVELVDQQGLNISKIVGDKASVEAFYPDGTTVDLNPQVSSVVDQDSVCYFRLFANDGYGVPNRPVLMWKLKCKEVFGDDEFRIIESNWKEHGQCTSFIFESKTYVPELKKGYWTARVVINR